MSLYCSNHNINQMEFFKGKNHVKFKLLSTVLVFLNIPKRKDIETTIII